MTDQRRPRIALVAFTAQPGLGSEYEVGWRWALLAARVTRATVLTRRACWEAIPGQVRLWRGNLLKRSRGLTFIAIDLPGARRFFPGRRLMRSHYLFWQVLVLVWLRRNRQAFALVHHVAFVAAWFPPLAAFAGLPFLWGPIGTNPPIPDFYSDRLGTIDRLKVAGRTLVNRSLVRYNPLLPLVARRCLGAFAISGYVRGLLPADLQTRTEVHPAIGVAEDWITEDIAGLPPPTVAMLFVGRAMEFKLPRLAYQVMGTVCSLRPGTRAVMIGEDLPHMLKDETSFPAVELREHIAQDQLQKLYRESRMLVFPSVEPSGFVTIEALANGLPVACIEGYGAATFTGEDGPLVVPIEGGWNSVHDGMVTAIIAYLDNPGSHAAAESHARDRAREFTWNSYLPFLERLYARALTQFDRPDRLSEWPREKPHLQKATS